jgi:hypothetical protein
VDHHNAFRQWILERLLPNFPLEGSIIVTPSAGRRPWGFPVNNGALRALAKSFKEESWPGEDVRAAMEKIKAWWLHDWPDLSNDISLVNELQDELWSGSTVLTLFSRR